jgi:ABC-type transporter Mla MlaB component
MSFVERAGLIPEMTTNETPGPVGQGASPATRPCAPRPPPERVGLVMVLSGPIARADIPALCERARGLLKAGHMGSVICDVAALVEPDAVTVDALARLQLTARRSGLQLRLRHAAGGLEGLITLMGLGDVLPAGEASGLEERRQPEEREESLGVQEEADPGDPTV